MTVTTLPPGRTTRIEVAGERPYQVVVGAEVPAEVCALLGPGVETVALVHAAGLAAVTAPIATALRRTGRRVELLTVPAGEAAKEVAVLAGLWSRLAELGMTRSDALVGVGGGATTDLVGFLGASWLRGTKVVLVPTTLLAMVDAAVGGKTAINIPEGKNLVGAFHSPAGVLCNPAVLASVPVQDHISGLAEAIKAGFIADPAILDLVEADPEQAARPGEGPHTRELIERAVRVKARVVAADPREAGLREILNYGHTLGHAIERVERYRYRHGHAVAVGMMFAAELAHGLGLLDAVTVARHRSLLAAVGLPTSYRADAWPELRAAMRVDKKARGAALRLVLLDRVGSASVHPAPDERLLHDAYRKVSQ